MPLTHPTSATADLIAAANQVLSDTPDPVWWKMRPVEVVAFAFPDWDIVGIVENENYNKPVVSSPRVLLRHRIDPTQWFLMWSPASRELLPGRMSTMGQFYRFNPERSQFVSGTADEVVQATYRRHREHNRRGLCWWLLDTLTRLLPGQDGQWEVNPADRDPLWALLRQADLNLHEHPIPDPSPADPAAGDGTYLRLSCAFPGWNVLGLDESPVLATRALLQSPTDPDLFLHLSSRTEHLLTLEPNSPGRVLGHREETFPHTQALLATSKDLIDEARASVAAWPTTCTDLWWLMHHLAPVQSDPLKAAAYADEPATALTMMALAGADDTDPVYRALRHMLPLGE